jgi:NADP-dependent aldehyde dehydrogenase
MATFSNINPGTGQQGANFTAASAADVDTAARHALDAFRAGLPRAARAAMLEAAADEITALGDALLDTAAAETGLPAKPRLAGERDRTAFQLRMFANVVREGSWIDAAIDRADPARTPLPKPDLRRMLRPLGPVAVFGASNFPLAYSVAGGDTASALAAGCPVIVKGHPAHPATSAMVAQALDRAVAKAGLHPGTFKLLQSGGDRDIDVGKELVTHPAIKAVGFTGSTSGGMALVRLASARPDHIPVFAEMGSVNPVVILPEALAANATDIASKLATSAAASNGQMCTCPGLIFASLGPGFEAFKAALVAAFAAAPSAPMLTPRVKDGYLKRLSDNAKAAGVAMLAGSETRPGPALLTVDAANFIANPTLHEECFGPAAILVVCRSAEEMEQAVGHLPGSLTGTLWADTKDDALPFVDLLAARVGRFIVNGVPTGVEVSPAMVHSGPMPSCNRPDSTAVGPQAIRRWCRPVCYQNVPQNLLPEELRV